MREYTTVDKSGWGDGPWQHEPDKKQWVDAKTGLDCLIVRGPVGSLCGYVGVPESHPWYGQGYSGCLDPSCEAAAEGGYCYEHSPESKVEVHGGITYSDECHEPTEEQWLKLPELLKDEYLLKHAAQYPNGDAARRLAELQKQSLMTYQEWFDYENSHRICHVPEPGRPAKVWWFGFDCSHFMDASPGFATMAGGSSIFSEKDGRSYRTMKYVEKEVAEMARQLYEADPDAMAIDALDAM